VEVHILDCAGLDDVPSPKQLRQAHVELHVPDGCEGRQIGRARGPKAEIPRFERERQQVDAEIVGLQLDLPRGQECGDSRDDERTPRTRVKGKQQQEDDQAEPDTNPRDYAESPPPAGRRAAGFTGRRNDHVGTQERPSSHHSMS
jgi:hypothetical protein